MVQFLTTNIYRYIAQYDASNEKKAVGCSSESEERDLDGGEPEEDDELTYQSSDVESTGAPPRRIRYAPPPSYVPPRIPSVERPSTELTQEEDPESGWTKEAISSWARKCSASSESPRPPITTDDV